MGAIFSAISGIATILKALMGLWNALQKFRDEQRRKELEEQNQRQDKAVEDLKRAQTEEEFNRAQEEIVKNSPTSNP